jgi:hypothetical protein
MYIDVNKPRRLQVECKLCYEGLMYHLSVEYGNGLYETSEVSCVEEMFVLHSGQSGF